MFSFLWLNLCFGSTFPPTKSRQRTLGKDHRVLFCFNFMERVQEFGLFRKGTRAWKSCILSLLSTSLKIRGLCSLSFSSQPFASLSLPPSFSSFLLPLSLKISFSLPTWIWLDITTQRLPLFPIIKIPRERFWTEMVKLTLAWRWRGWTKPSEVKWSEFARSCLTLCDPMNCRLPGSSVCGIFQARVLEWVVISFSRGSSWPRDRTRVSQIAGRCFTIWTTRKALSLPPILWHT